MAVTSLDVAFIEREIEALVAAYPELAEDETLRADMIAGSTEAVEVLNRVVRQMLAAKTLAAALKSEIEEATLRRQRMERREHAMRDLAARIMEAADLKKMELPRATLSMRAVPPVPIVDESELPDEFFRVTKTADKTAIREAVKAGQFIPGVTMSNGSVSLSVRVA